MNESSDVPFDGVIDHNKGQLLFVYDEMTGIYVVIDDANGIEFWVDFLTLHAGNVRIVHTRVRCVRPGNLRTVHEAHDLMARVSDMIEFYDHNFRVSK